MMTTNIDTTTSALDRIKLASAIMIAAVAMGGFYYFAAEVALLYRVLALLGAGIIAVLIALQSEPGRQLAEFIREAQIETRKVVWPTRQEAFQTTLLVFGVVFVTGVILWALDWVLNAAIQAIIGG